jgi:hypothetical protein
MKKNQHYIKFEFIVDSRFDNNGNLAEMRKSIENLKNRLEKYYKPCNYKYYKIRFYNAK